jgi:hypothetical protein
MVPDPAVLKAAEDLCAKAMAALAAYRRKKPDGQRVGARLRRASERRESAGVMPRRLNLIELIIRHPGFRVRLYDGERAIGATPAAAKSFRAVVSVTDLGQVQASIAPA